MADSGSSVQLADVAASLRRRWLVLVGVFALALIAGLTVGLATPATYSAVSVVTVNPFSPPYGDSSGQDVSMNTERAVVQSRLVADNARERMGTGQDPRDLADRITVTSPEDAQVLEIEAAADNPAEAAETANAFAAGYLAVREEAVTGDVEQQVNRLDERINELTGELGNEPGAETPADQSVQNEINNLRERRSDLVASSANPGRVITEAAPPRDASSPSLLVYLAGGAAAGLIGGVALALLRERFDARVRSADRLATVTQLGVIDLPGAPSEHAARVAMRLGLGTDSDVTNVVVIGVDAVSAARLGDLLVAHLTATGVGAWHAPWQQAPTTSGATSTDPSGRRPVSVHSTAAAAGVSTATALALRADRVVVTTSYRAELRDVSTLLDELAAVHVEVHAVVGVETAHPAGSLPAGSATGSAPHMSADDHDPAGRP